MEPYSDETGQRDEPQNLTGHVRARAVPPPADPLTVRVSRLENQLQEMQQMGQSAFRDLQAIEAAIGMELPSGRRQDARPQTQRG